jgi:ADP-ribose pyrophosphatase
VEGRYIVARRRGRWEYVGRTRQIQAAVILGGRGWPCPAGRAVPGAARAAIPRTAGGPGRATRPLRDDRKLGARELEEETGWRPARVEQLGTFASSPGMVSETFTLVRASA